MLRLPPEQAKLHLMLPHLAALLLKLRVSSLGAALRAATGCSLRASRRAFCAAGFATTALPLLALPLVSDPAAHAPALTTALFCVALAGTGLHAEGFRANYLDVTTAHVGAVAGLGNALSSVAAMGAPLLVGAIVEASGGQWGPVWRAGSATCAVAAAVFCSLSTAQPVDAPVAAGKED